MRVAAQTVYIAVFCLLAFFFLQGHAYAQTINSSYPSGVTTASNFLNPNTYPDVPQNHHTFAQVELIDIVSAAMCQLTGIDPSNPTQPCLTVDTTNGKIGFASSGQQQFGQASSNHPQLSGAVGVMTQYISFLYIPAVSSTQYIDYLAGNFGIVKQADAATNNCNSSPFGYGFCGLNPLLKLWSDVRDLAYAFLTILFIAIGIGVMLRFRVDPRTVMTLQNQIPRVIIAILLITFSFAIAGALIDVMWTVTYVGVNFISNASPNSKIALDCANPNAKSINISQGVETRLADQPISFTNTVFRADCNGWVDNGLLHLADSVSISLGDLVQQLVHDILFNNGSSCHSDWNPLQFAKCALVNGALNVFLWLAEKLVILIIVIALLIALFRLWLKLLQCYITFLIFVILGPIWIVLGLIPGRPLGFEKWLRIIFANLAVFPLVAFILVFARVITDIVPTGPSSPSTVFVPPLVGNPSLSTFSDLMGFGAIMIAPNIPDIIKDRMKAKSQSNLAAAVAAGAGMAATAFSSPGKRAWESLNRRNPTTGAPEGALAVQRAKLTRSLPIVGRRVIARDIRRDNMLGYTRGDVDTHPVSLREIRSTLDSKGHRIPQGSGGTPSAPASSSPTGSNPTVAPPRRQGQTTIGDLLRHFKYGRSPSEAPTTRPAGGQSPSETPKPAPEGPEASPKSTRKKNEK